jgi:hypothetical protein
MVMLHVEPRSFSLNSRSNPYAFSHYTVKAAGIERSVSMLMAAGLPARRDSL